MTSFGLRILTLVISLQVASAAAAQPIAMRDLPKTDPDRASILNAARRNPNDRFVVKTLIKSGDYAFLCALTQEKDGRLSRTDDSIDKTMIVLHRKSTGWHIKDLDTAEAFAKDDKNVDCRYLKKPVRPGNLESMFVHGVERTY